MNAIYKDRISIDCTRGKCGTLSRQDPADIHSIESPVPVLEANLTPSNIALSLLVGQKIICPFANHAGRKWLLTVIFDTGASLSITHDLGDFVEPPKPLARPMRLGGFANGKKIEGIGIVAWGNMVWKYNSLWKHVMFQRQSKDCCLLKHFCEKREYLDPTLEMRRSLS
jgi:hypothetical protein